MSAGDLAYARRILDGARDGGVGRPADYDLRVVEALAAIAQAEALDALVNKLSALSDDDTGHVLRIEVVPR